MSCAGSKRVESSKGFDCRNMGDVLGKECEKEDSSLTQTVDDVLRVETEGAVSSGPGSESDSEKDLDSDEDLSWLLPNSTMELGAKNCKCEGCLKLFESYSSDKKNAKLLLSSWKEFRNYLRNVYINSPLEAIQKNENISFEDNERLHEIVQVMRLCDPYQLFQKIEDEVCSMVLESRIRQLNMLKDENNPALAEEFIAGLIEEYVKLLSSALQLSPAIENLLGPQLQRFGLTWEVLNKQLYRSLVYNHFDVQQNLIRFIEQLRKMLPLKDDIYHELVHQYLALDGEMTLIGSMWKNVEPLIQEYRNLKSKENEKLNNLLDAMKDFFTNKLCSTEEEAQENHNKITRTASDESMQYCPNCMTRRGCPCDECTVTHMMSCEDILLGIESPLDGNSPSRSRSPSQNVESKNGKEVEEQQSCECHACTMPPPDLMDCSVAFNQSTGKNATHGEGFQLYPHIHGTTSEAENVSNIYGSLQTTNDSVYPHLYNLNNQTNSVDSNAPQINTALRDQLVQAIVANKMNSQSYKSAGSPPSPPPPPPPSQESTPLSKNPPQSLITPEEETVKKSATPKKQPEQPATVKKSAEANKANDTNNAKVSEKSKTQKQTPPPKTEGKKNQLEKKGATTKESGASEKVAAEKGGKQQNNKSNGCVISGICGKCCLKHGSNCLKMSGCNKGTDKHLATIARLGLSANSNSRTPLRCTGGKDDHSHRTAKSHSCNKTKHQETVKKATGKRNLEVDESTSPEDSCSEASNSTSASAQKDPRHCDCCYCEVFGHGVPSVAPVNRNYQEMRERLRLRLNMKKSAKCKPLPPGQVPQPAGQKVAGANAKPQVNSVGKPDAKKEVRELDLQSVLNYIEGKKNECKDAKKAAKRARQKQRKLEEKERLEEEERERKRLEAVKRQVTISLVNDNKSRSQDPKVNRQQQKQPVQNQRISQPQTLNFSGQNQRISQPQTLNFSGQNQRISQPQTLNLSGLKSLVEKSDPNAVPKMVTIRRVMAPFSSEPTVTITLKGSTPDKDKVLFMLKNGTEAVPVEEEPISKKSKKKKKKAKQMEEEEEYEPVYEPPVEPVTSKKKKKKNKEVEPTNNVNLVPNRVLSKKLVPVENVPSKNAKSKTSKTSANVTVSSNAKSSSGSKTLKNSTVQVQPQNSKVQPKTKVQPQNSKVQPQNSKVQPQNGKVQPKNSKVQPQSGKVQSQNGKVQPQNGKVQPQSGKVKPQNSNVQPQNSKVQLQNSKVQAVSNSKTVSQKNNSVLKGRNQEPVGKTSKNNANVGKKSVQNTYTQASSVVNSKNSVKGAGVSSNVKKGAAGNGKSQQQNEPNQRVKTGKSQNNVLNVECEKKKGKKQREEINKTKSVQSVPSVVQVSQTKNKTNNKSQNNQKIAKNVSGLQEIVQRFNNLEILPVKDKPKKSKSSKKSLMDEVDVNCRIREKQDNGKVIINTPSFRLSEVLSSMAPSPPPKEEINLENLRLPPGITITKIEGPIQKPVKPSIQPSQFPKPSPPIVMAPPVLKPTPPPGNVIVVDTGRLKEVVKENSHLVAPPVSDGVSSGKKKKKKNKKQAENITPTIEVPINQARFGVKVPKTVSPLNKRGVTMLSSMDARKMVPSLENQQATIIKTSDNMVTIRSPALQQAMNIHAYQNGQSYKPVINGYNNMSLFNEDVSRMNNKIGKLKLTPDSDDRLTRQMRNLNIKDGNRANELLAQAMMAASQNTQGSSKKKKKKKKQGKSGDEREVEPVESVFQPKDIDLENGDIDDDERELEAFKRFCLQSIPPERKNKVKVNLNIKDIVLKKKSSAIGCS